MMEALLKALVPYVEHVKAIKSSWDEATESLLRNLGSVLAENSSCKTVKHVHKLCVALLPHLRASVCLLSGELETQHLQLFLELKIPANLVKFMALTLRAGYPLTPLPESAKATSEIAAHVWTLGADLFKCLIGLCPKDTNSPYSTFGRALIEQLATGIEGQEPGKGLV
jgi:hypothetical protein